MSSPSSVVDFYRGKSLFITGATGFVGKVLVEKLLRSCPGIETVYLLMRPGFRDGKSPDRRLKEFFQSRAFKFASTPLLLHKIVAIAGDMTKPGLGISPEDRHLLAEKVSVIFHSAATVKFQGPLKEFIKQNVLGTEAIMQLAGEMKHLQSIVYVSTAYANCNILDIEEKVYPLGEMPIQTVIKHILAKKSNRTPNEGDPELMGRPNSYTLSKAIAENLVAQQYGHLPVVICRPSIVTHALKDPIAGWCDSLNGLAGNLLFGTMGIARTMEMDCHYKADIIPVDYVTNALIVAGWHTATFPEERRLVMHLTTGVQNPITWGQILDFARMSALKSPSIKQVRPLARNPISARGIRGKVNHLFTIFFSHILFAYLFDVALLLTGNRPIMVKMTQKMHVAFDVIKHFTSHQWNFHYENYSRILEKVSEDEQEVFQSEVASIDWPRYSNAQWMGSRRYSLNEDDSNIADALKRQQRLTLIYSIVEWTIYVAVGAVLSLLVGKLIYSSLSS